MSWSQFTPMSVPDRDVTRAEALYEQGVTLFTLSALGKKYDTNFTAELLRWRDALNG